MYPTHRKTQRIPNSQLLDQHHNYMVPENNGQELTLEHSAEEQGLMTKPRSRSQRGVCTVRRQV